MTGARRRRSDMSSASGGARDAAARDACVLLGCPAALAAKLRCMQCEPYSGGHRTQTLRPQYTPKAAFQRVARIRPGTSARQQGSPAGQHGWTVETSVQRSDAATGPDGAPGRPCPGWRDVRWDTWAACSAITSVEVPLQYIGRTRNGKRLTCRESGNPGDRSGTFNSPAITRVSGHCPGCAARQQQAA